MTPQERLTSIMMKVRGDHPFFGTLGLFAQFVFDDQTPTAATDGRTIWLNPDFVKPLAFEEYAGLVAHELLHAALHHPGRRQERQPLVWNIAADIVVNGIIERHTAYKLPAGAVSEKVLSTLSVEEVYEQLRHNKSRKKLPTLSLADLKAPAVKPGAGDQNLEIGNYWRSVLNQAMAIARQTGRGFGSNPVGIFRELQEVQEPTLPWRELLWQYIVSTPSDYSGFDRRFIGKRLYLDDIVGETLSIAIAIDTSGSIGQAELREFLGEVQGMLDAYPHLVGILYFADAKLYGPYPFASMDEIPMPRGGGGTSFAPFFRAVNEDREHDYSICVYLTDGFGDYPSNAPDFEVIWVITPGGAQTQDIPFGRVVRMGH